MTDLPDAPSTPIVDGTPAIGTYRGSLERTTLAAGDRIGRLSALLRGKRWQWFAVADDELAVGGAIVDAGPVGTVFCWLVDRAAGDLLVDASRLLPPLSYRFSTATDGRLAAVRLGRDPLTVERSGSRVRITGSVGDVALDLELEADPDDAVTAICPVAGAPPGAINVTRKEVTTRASGTVVAPGRRHAFSSAVGALDHSHGLLARETRWRWAIGVGTADGDPVGVNLVSGFNDGLENVVWVDGRPRPVGEATIEVPDGDDRGWRARTDDGAVEIRLEAAAERVANRDVGVVASRYRQPVGSWSGRVAGRDVEGLFGVAECHRARW